MRTHASTREDKRTSSIGSSIASMRAIVRSRSALEDFALSVFSSMEQVMRFGAIPLLFMSSTRFHTSERRPSLSYLATALMISLYVTWFGAKPAVRMSCIKARGPSWSPCCRYALIIVLYETWSTMPVPCICFRSAAASSNSLHSTHASRSVFQRETDSSMPLSWSNPKRRVATLRLPLEAHPRIRERYLEASAGDPSSNVIRMSSRPHCKAAITRQRSVLESSESGFVGSPELACFRALS
mmetsp:Transcript_30919/g.67758  ORF Transcript_30919/g.67758 Transcript_30919/m.67758 type:complete len:241 (-) Transcript_30919:1266-1988(-)